MDSVCVTHHLEGGQESDDQNKIKMVEDAGLRLDLGPCCTLCDTTGRLVIVAIG